MKSKSISRRGFLGGIAIAGVAASIPEVKGTSTWAQAQAALAALKAAYLSELEHFAEALRPRFESGELRAESSPEDDWAPRERLPQEKLEDLAATHFGFEVTVDEREDGTYYDGDETIAHAILAVSPHTSVIDGGDWNHIGYYAGVAVGWDVIALARARGWYTPSREEQEDPIIGYPACPDCGDHVDCHDEKRCQVGPSDNRCRCTRRHAPHVPGWLA